MEESTQSPASKRIVSEKSKQIESNRQSITYLKLLHRNIIPQMSLQQLMRDKPLRTIPLGIDETDMVVHIADALEFVRVAMI